MKKAFTLAEIMIALVVIGIITSILLPVAFNNIPNENVMKFKKGNATLAKVINELVTSGEYYKDGDLGIKADGTSILGGFSVCGDNNVATKDENLIKYFCTSFADVVNAKEINCSTVKNCEDDQCTFLGVTNTSDEINANWQIDFENAKERLDELCLEFANSTGAEITTLDGISYYQTNPAGTFGIIWIVDDKCTTDSLFKFFTNYPQVRFYKPFCMDIDGINKGEDPFGYGIRVDGKILLGTRAQQWLEKSLQDKE